MYKIFDEGQQAIFSKLVKEIPELYNFNFLNRNRYKSGTFFLQNKYVSLIGNSILVDNKIIKPFKVFGDDVGFIEVENINFNESVRFKISFQILEKKTFLDWINCVENKNPNIKKYDISKFKNIILQDI